MTILVAGAAMLMLDGKQPSSRGGAFGFESRCR
jgi:hypothetical protein